jgi:hypothetical protein
MEPGKIIIPESLLERDPEQVGEVERHRQMLLSDIINAAALLGEAKLKEGARSARSALDSTLPGAVSVGYALSAHVVIAANVCGALLDQLEAAPSGAADEGRVKACAQAFESVLKNRQRFIAQMRLAKRMAALQTVN